MGKIINLKFLTYTVKSKFFAGIRRVFLSITFLFTPIQLIQFFHWKLFKRKRSITTQTLEDSLIDHGKLDEKKPKAKVAVILHVFYPDIGIEILHQILPNSHYFDKILVTHSMTQDVFTEFQSSAPQELLSKCHFMIVENRFRDCGPFIQAVSSPYLSDCEVFLKLHTKKSPHLPNNEGALWRRDLIDGLLNPKDIENLVNRLAGNSKPLWTCPEPWISTKSDWGFNSFQVWKLTKALGISFLGPQPFPVGNMYWLNSHLTNALTGLKFDSNLESITKLSSFGDGALQHAIERMPANFERLDRYC